MRERRAAGRRNAILVFMRVGLGRTDRVRRPGHTERLCNCPRWWTCHDRCLPRPPTLAGKRCTRHTDKNTKISSTFQWCQYHRWWMAGRDSCAGDRPSAALQVLAMPAKAGHFSLFFSAFACRQRSMRRHITICIPSGIQLMIVHMAATGFTRGKAG